MAIAMEVDDDLKLPGARDLGKKTKKKKKAAIEDEEQADEDITESESDTKWNLRTVSGLDLIGKEVSVTPDSKHVVVASGDRVLVYAAASGQIVRSLNTGLVLAAVVGQGEGEVYVATKKKICLWNFHTVKIVEQFALSSKESKSEFISSDILDIFIPASFKTSGIIFVTAKHAMKNVLFRLNLNTHESNKIFKDIKVGSVHVGDSGNCVCAIGSLKEGKGRDAVVLVYDQNLSKVFSMRTDQERPFTVARLHPAERCVAAGDKSGRILVYSGLQQVEPAKSILHWHSLACTGLSWSEEGATLYSGGGEAVLCKWRKEEVGKPQCIPRLGAPIVGVGGGGGVTVLQLANNSLVLMDRQEDRVRGVVGGLGKSETGWPAGVQVDGDKLLMNGCVGKVQVFSTRSGGVHSLDITGQNYLTKERCAAPHNSEVERVAVSDCGRFMATVDCQWSAVARVTLKIWTYDPAIGNFSLNTQVDSPHLGAVASLQFQPCSPTPLLLSVGQDSRAKLWAASTSSWTCSSSLQLRGLACTAGSWSSDGTVLGLAFSHLVTLWDTESRLRSTLAVEGATEAVSSLAFGRGPSARLLFAGTQSKVTAWDLLSLAPAWSTGIDLSPHTRLVPCPTAPLLAVVQKDRLSLLCSLTSSTLHALEETNCTGGAAWVPDIRADSGAALYFLTYSGQLQRLGSRHSASSVTPLTSAPSHLGRLLTTGRGTAGAGKGVRLWTKARQEDDIEALLSLPLHTLPPPSELRTSFVRNRLLALPRLRPVKTGRGEVINTNMDAETRKKVEKFEAVFKFEEEAVESINFKAFCKLFKSTTVPS